jgi:hypothetical protein
MADMVLQLLDAVLQFLGLAVRTINDTIFIVYDWVTVFITLSQVFEQLLTISQRSSICEIHRVAHWDFLHDLEKATNIRIGFWGCSLCDFSLV